MGRWRDAADRQMGAGGQLRCTCRGPGVECGEGGGHCELMEQLCYACMLMACHDQRVRAGLSRNPHLLPKSIALDPSQRDS